MYSSVLLFVHSALLQVDCVDNNLRVSDYYFGTYDESQNSMNKLSKTNYKVNILKSPLNEDFPDLVHDEDKITSTTEILRTTPYPECPSDKSLLSIKDLQRMVNETIDRVNIERQIYANYHSPAETIVEKYNEELNTFLHGYTDRPTHLIHILEYIQQMHDEIRRKVDKLNLTISDINDQREKYSLLQENVTMVKDLFNKAKLFCEMCDSDNSPKLELFQIIYQMPYNNDYFCASVPTVQKIIQDDLMKFQDTTIVTIASQIQKDNSDYDNKINEFTNNLKNLALKQFGTVMYEILSLVDDYRHYNEVIELASDVNLDDIDNQLIQIEVQIPNLKRNIATLKKLCINKCPMQSNPIANSKTTPGLPTFTTSSDSMFILQDPQNILETLLKETQNNMLNKVYHNYTKIFTELNEKLNANDAEIEEKYLPELKEINKEIRGRTENAVNRFLYELRRFTPENEIKGVKNLTRNCKALYEDVENTRTELNSMIKNIHHKV